MCVLGSTLHISVCMERICTQALPIEVVYKQHPFDIECLLPLRSLLSFPIPPLPPFLSPPSLLYCHSPPSSSILSSLLSLLPSFPPHSSSLGVSVGRICVHHQPGSTACVCATADGEVLQQVGRVGGRGGRRGGEGGGGWGEKVEGIMSERRSRMWEKRKE